MINKIKAFYIYSFFIFSISCNLFSSDAKETQESKVQSSLTKEQRELYEFYRALFADGSENFYIGKIWKINGQDHGEEEFCKIKSCDYSTLKSMAEQIWNKEKLIKLGYSEARLLIALKVTESKYNIYDLNYTKLDSYAGNCGFCVGCLLNCYGRALFPDKYFLNRNNWNILYYSISDTNYNEIYKE